MMENVPVFVKIGDYKEIVEILGLTREKISQARFLLSKIGEIKAQEDAVIADWAREIEEVEQRVDDIDKTLVHKQLK
ncbi:hypothetical protein GF342_05150 [Candidatus Woesearchaeota archaeon]|nr:hypothetical protein [Candidatus Woesearchaeota archaeon]